MTPSGAGRTVCSARMLAPPRPTAGRAKAWGAEPQNPGATRGGVAELGGRTTMKKIRINLASHAELLEIPGLTSQQAEVIVRHRVQHGPIKDADQLAASVLRMSTLPPGLRDNVDFSPADGTAPEAPGA